MDELFADVKQNCWIGFAKNGILLLVGLRTSILYVLDENAVGGRSLGAVRCDIQLSESLDREEASLRWQRERWVEVDRGQRLEGRLHDFEVLRGP